MPLADGKVDKLEGFVEVDYRIQNEVKLTVHEFGLSYIGFIVPSSIFDAHGEPLPVWDVIPGGSEVGGHAVILVAYDADFVTVISWGRLFKMTWAFFENYCKEAYALIDKSWLNATGKTPLGLTLHQIESLMSELRA